MAKKKLLVLLTLCALLGLSLGACGETPSGAAEPKAAPASAAVQTTAATTAAKVDAATTSASTLNAGTTKVAGTTIAGAKPGTVGAVAPTLAPGGNPANGGPTMIRFNEFYAPNSSSIDLILSDKLKGANNRQIKISGYMAPPLKPALDFFVLTRIKLATCPFCSTAADWPEDIVLVTMPPGKEIQLVEEPITVVGKLEIGEAVDPQTGFFSLLRLRADSVEVFKGS